MTPSQVIDNIEDAGINYEEMARDRKTTTLGK